MYGKDVNIGDVLIGFVLSGVYSNGYLFVRKVFGIDENFKVFEKIYEEFGLLFGEELLKFIRIYVKFVLKVFEKVNVKGIVYIIGGGFFENIFCVFLKGYFVVIEKGSWEEFVIFGLI